MRKKNLILDYFGCKYSKTLETQQKRCEGPHKKQSNKANERVDNHSVTWLCPKYSQSVSVETPSSVDSTWGEAI